MSIRINNEFVNITKRNNDEPHKTISEVKKNNGSKT